MDREETTERFASEYLGRNTFIGISPFSPVQISIAEIVGKDEDGPRPGVSVGADGAMFGVDYPQAESIFDRTMGEVATLVAAPGVTDEEARKILMETAAKVYGFDLEALQPHVDRVGFELADVRENAEELTRTMPHDTKAPMMRSSLARAAV